MAANNLELSLAPTPEDFPSLFTNLNALLLSSSPNPRNSSSKTLAPLFSAISLSPRNPNPNPRSLLKSIFLLDRALIGAAAGGMAGAFTYVCLLPIDTVKTKLQTKGAAQIYDSALDAAVKDVRSDGVLGFYRGVSAVLIGSASSSAVYFGTCEFGKSLLGILGSFSSVLIPPTAGP